MSGLSDSTNYSSDPEVEEMQKKAEQLNIFEMIKNIANNGDTTKDEANIIEWEECALVYKKLNRERVGRGVGGIGIVSIMSNINNSNQIRFSVNTNTYLTMKDGTVLFSSENRTSGINMSKEYIKAFRNGKWVDRLKAYSDKLTGEYQQSLVDQENIEKEKKLAPFSNIDF